MELFVIASILSAGYYLKKDEIPPLTPNEILDTIEENIYDGGDKANNILRGEFRASDQIYKDARGSYSSNRIEPGPPKRVFNKVDYEDENLPVEFRDISKQGESGGRGGRQPRTDEKVMSISGELVNKKEFRHNNMQPFFGGRVKQNVENFANSHRLEEQTGNTQNYRRKQETKVFFEPQANLTNPYGSSNLSGYMNDRYISSNKRNNEVPVEKIYVGPGLNNGYTAEPDGGFHQPRTRDFCMPKDVDELRVRSNPKMVYHGRVVAGQKGSELGKFGKMTKNRPETSFEHGPERFFGGMAQCTKPTAKQTFVDRDTHRQKTVLNSHVGPAGPSTTTRERVRANVEQSRKQQFDFSKQQERNRDANGSWTINQNQSQNQNQQTIPNDYGRSTMRASDTKHADSCETTHVTNINGPQQPSAPINPELRYTRKEYHIDNPNPDGYIKGCVDGHQVYDKKDLPRTTMKETTINNERDGNLKGENKPIVYDPSDVLRTTMKETMVHNERDGNIDGVQRNDGYQIANVEAKSTIKQHLLTEYTSNANGDIEGGYKIKKIVLPNTSRQFTSDLEYTGNAGNSSNPQMMSYEDIYNATTMSMRDQNSVSHTPGMQGPNRPRHSDDLNITTHKIGTQQSASLAKRVNVGTLPCAPTPSVQQLGESKDKMTVSNNVIADRLDCNMVNAFKENPYTQSLYSF